MSIERKVTATCPGCELEQEVVVWHSLNVQVSPEARADFFEGKINVFRCESCGHAAGMGIPFLYHDMNLRFCVQYYPQNAVEDEETLRNYKVDGTLAADLFAGMLPPEPMRDKAHYMTQPHVVFSMQEALLYVVFRENLALYHSLGEAPEDTLANPES